MPTPIRTKTTVLDDFELIGRRRAVTVVGGQKATFEWVVTDPDHRPVDLTAYVPPSSPPSDPPPSDGSANPAYGAGVLGPPYPPVLGRLGERAAALAGE